LFGEQGQFAHNPYNVYFPQLHVPLIIKSSKLKHCTIDKSILLSDVSFLILELLKTNDDVEFDYDFFNIGRDFIISEGFKIDEINKNGVIDPIKISYSCIWNNWQLIYNRNDNFIQLFNIKNDPEVSNDIKNKYSNLVIELEKIIKNHIHDKEKKIDRKNHFDKKIITRNP
jgi:hypothetical protein